MNKINWKLIILNTVIFHSMGLRAMGFSASYLGNLSKAHRLDSGTKNVGMVEITHDMSQEVVLAMLESLGRSDLHEYRVANQFGEDVGIVSLFSTAMPD